MPPPPIIATATAPLLSRDDNGEEFLLPASPVHDAESGVTWFTDIPRSVVYGLDVSAGAASLRRVELGEGLYAGSVALIDGEKDSLALATQHGISKLDLTTPTPTTTTATPTLTPVNTLFPGDPTKQSTLRLNDGGIDPHGRFWTGAMRTFTLGAPLAEGTLFRSDPTTHLNHVKYPVRVPAGVGFSPTCDTLYFAEAGERVVYAYRFEGETGGVSHERVLIKFAEGNGVPWGVAVGEDGDLWVGMYGGGKVVRVDAASGAVKGVIGVPESRLVVGVAFVGEGLLVTTARLELEGVLGEEEAGEDDGKHAGSLFYVPLPGIVGREIYKARFDKVPEDPGTTSGKVAVKDKDKKKVVPAEFEPVFVEWPAGVEMPKPEKETPKPEELAG